MIGKVSASMCDSEARLSLLGAVCLVQDYVSEFYGKNHIDQTSMRRNWGAMWVFSKTRLKLHRPIMWNEEYRVECFVSSKTSVKMVVDTYFYVGDDRVLSCQIENCMVDIASQKIRRIDDVLANIIPSQTKMEGAFGRFDFVGEKVDEITVRSTSIDYCHHTNNTEYIRFVLNLLSVEEQILHPKSEFEIHYLAQTHEGDSLSMYSEKVRESTFVSIMCGDKKVTQCVIK